LLNAPTSAELPAKLKRYRGDCFPAAVQDRKAAASLVEAATAHVAILAAPTTTLFDDPQEEQAAYGDWCTGLSDSAMLLAQQLWPYRLRLPAASKIAADNQKQRVRNAQKRGRDDDDDNTPLPPAKKVVDIDILE
jgi:hypothetical protein